MTVTLQSNQYSWSVKLFVLTPGFSVEPVLASLQLANMDSYNKSVAADMICSEDTDWGFTFTHSSLPSTLMVIGPSNSLEGYLNTIIHESYHLAKHMAEKLGTDPFSEELAYISGDFCQTVLELLTLIPLKFNPLQLPTRKPF